MYMIEILLVLGIATFAQGTNSSLLLNWQSSWIIGGTDAALGEFPYMALLKVARETCSGSIIRHSFILTAAHCVAKIPVASVSVRVGIIRGGKSSIKISHIVIHPGFDGNTNQNDIALLKLRKPLAYSTWVQPIPLPGKGENTPAGTECVFAGWRTIEGSGPQLGNVQKLQVRMISNYIGRQHCNPVFDTDVCALSGTGQGVALGDSGGPLVCGGKLIGILSGKGQRTCISYRIGVYAGVSNFVDWINQYAWRRSSV